MKLVPFGSHFNPTREFQTLDRFFNDFLGAHDIDKPENTVWYPALDLKETEEGYQLVADLPGLSKDDITISVENGMLSIHGERKSEHEESGEGYNRVERWSGAFYRRMNLPRDIDEDKIEACYENGVLKLNIPKAESARPRRIEVKS